MMAVCRAVVVIHISLLICHYCRKIAGILTTLTERQNQNIDVYVRRLVIGRSRVIGVSQG